MDDPLPEADAAAKTHGVYERRIAARFNIADRGRPADRWQSADEMLARLEPFVLEDEAPR